MAAGKNGKRDPNPPGPNEKLQFLTECIYFREESEENVGRLKLAKKSREKLNIFMKLLLDFLAILYHNKIKCGDRGDALSPRHPGAQGSGLRRETQGNVTAPECRRSRRTFSCFCGLFSSLSLRQIRDRRAGRVCRGRTQGGAVWTFCRRIPF